jgi:hypothetical protein
MLKAEGNEEIDAILWQVDWKSTTFTLKKIRRVLMTRTTKIRHE